MLKVFNEVEDPSGGAFVDDPPTAFFRLLAALMAGPVVVLAALLVYSAYTLWQLLVG